MASGTTIAKAFVQVVPTTKNIKGELKSQLGGEAKSAGDDAGKQAGDGLVGKLKSVIAAAAIGDIVKKTLDAGGAVQQSFGGLDTLYGEASEAAKQYAKEAASAGISMNSYAEQAVSFGASLKSAFNGDVAKAAEAANTAILDMADNSAKMGTDIESVQAAYQGFAKGQYQLLDNLKLGYGGTKTEMQRLLKDAEKITGVKYDIDNLGDVYEAIHVIQGELGLTGVAADEASSTFTGSFGAMKAAGENFLASLALGDGVTESLTTLITSVGTFLFGNLIPMLLIIVQSIPEAIVGTVTTFLPQIQQTGMDILMELVRGFNQDYSSVFSSAAETINGFINGISSNLPNIVRTGIQVIESVVRGILSNLPGMISAAGSIIVTLVQAITSNLPTLLRQGWEMLKNLLQGIKNNLPAIGGSILEVVANICKAVLTNLPSILQAGFEILTELLVGIVNAIPKIPSAIMSVVNAIKQHFGGTDWAQLGRDLIQGLINGLLGAASSLYQAISNIIKNALSRGKSEAEVKSPSRKWKRELGLMLGLGMAEGIEESEKAVNKSVKELSSGALATGRVEVSGMASITTSGLANSKAGNVADALNTLINLVADVDGTMERKMANAVGSGVSLNISGREFGRLVRNYA